MQRHPVVEEDLRSIALHPLPWDDLADKVVLITGAGGFLPAYMVETLLWMNEQRNMRNPTRVIGLVRDRAKADVRFSAHRNRSDFTLLAQDVCKPLLIDGELDYIIHAASHASPKYYGIDPVGTLSANVLGTHHLLELAQRKQCRRFLFFSSSEIYGSVNKSMADESAYGYLDPLDVRSCYAESKRMGENMLVSWNRQFDLSTVIVRPFHTYGPGMDLNDGRVFADFVSDVVAGRDIVMKSDGTAVRSFCYLSDAVAGFFTVLLKGVEATAYNVGNDRSEISIVELAELLASLFPQRDIHVRRLPQVDESTYLKSSINKICPDITRIRSLGWAPTIGLKEGFLKTIRSFEPWA